MASLMRLKAHGLVKLEVLIALRLLLVQQVRKVGCERHVPVVGNRVERKLGMGLHHKVLLALNRRVELWSHVVRGRRLALVWDEADALIDLILLAVKSRRSDGTAIVRHLLAVDELGVLGRLEGCRRL